MKDIKQLWDKFKVVSSPQPGRQAARSVLGIEKIEPVEQVRFADDRLDEQVRFAIIDPWKVSLLLKIRSYQPYLFSEGKDTTQKSKVLYEPPIEKKDLFKLCLWFVRDTYW